MFSQWPQHTLNYFPSCSYVAKVHFICLCYVAPWTCDALQKHLLGLEKVNCSPKRSFHVGLCVPSAHGWVSCPGFCLGIANGPRGLSRTEPLFCSKEMGVLFGKFAQYNWESKGGVAKREDHQKGNGATEHWSSSRSLIQEKTGDTQGK